MGIMEDIKLWKANNPIKVFRKATGISQPDIASIIGVSVYTIQRWEDGAVNPSEENVFKLGKLIDGFSDQWKAWRGSKPEL